MSNEGPTPLEVPSVLELRDYDMALRCLEVIRQHLPTILPAGVTFRMEAVALCHHYTDNVYPALGVFGQHTRAEFEDAEARINYWVAERGLDWLIGQSDGIPAPSWASPRTAEATEE